MHSLLLWRAVRTEAIVEVHTCSTQPCSTAAQPMTSRAASDAMLATISGAR
jgi:hypothetical protein